MNKKYLIFLFLAIIGVALLGSCYNNCTVDAAYPISEQNAAIGESAEGENWVTRSIQNSVFWVLINIGRGLLTITQGLLDWVMSKEFISVGFVNNDIVNAGLEVTKNLGNIIIILASVIIALATILRIKEYQAQKTIPILIFVALLINFAPMICGVIIDASNITMSYFRDMGGLAPSMGKYIKEGLDHLTGTTLSGQERFGQGISLVVFSLFTSIIYLLYAILFAFRYIALWLLIIFSPLAFACYILKFTRKFFTQWWNQFLQWSIIGIPAMFILFLTNEMLKVLDRNALVSAAATGSTGGDIIFKYLLPVVFLIGGFFMTLQTGAAGASIVTGFFDKQVKAGAKKAGAFVADKTGVAGAKGAKKGLRKPALAIGSWMKKEKGEEGGETGETADREALEKQRGEISGFAYNLRRFGLGVERAVRVVPGIRAIGRSISAGADEANREEIKNKQKENEGKSLNYQGKTINSVQAIDRIAGLLAAIKDKNIKDLKEQGLITDKQIKRIMKDAIRIYPSAMGEMKKVISPRLVEEAVNDLGTIPELDLKRAGVHLSEDDIKKRKWTLREKLYATAIPKSIEDWDSDTLEEYANSNSAHLSASAQQFSAAAKVGGPQFINAYNKRSIKMAREAGLIKDNTTEKQKMEGLQEFYKNENRILHTYRNNNAAGRLGADIKTINISKLEEEIKQEVKEKIEKDKKPKIPKGKEKSIDKKNGSQFESISPKGKKYLRKTDKKDGSEI